MTTDTAPTAGTATRADTAGATAVDSRRFRVRADAFFVRHRDGVWLRNNAGSFSVNGAGAYELVASLLANLDGDRELEEIVDGLPDAARKSVLRLVDLLERNGFLKLVDYPVEVVPDWMRERYAAQLAFLEHHADRPVARMTRVRSRLVACVGEGVALRNLLGAAGEFGLAKVLVVTTPGAVDEVTEVVEEARARDAGLRWRTLIPGDSLDLTQVAGLPELAEAEHVLLAFDRDDHEVHDLVAAFQQAVGARGPAVGVLGRCGDYTVSVLGARDAGWCWRCVHRCIAAPVVGDASDLLPAAAPAAIAALRVVQHAFTSLAEVELDDPRTVTTVEPLAPVVRTHRARRHPLCDAHAAPAPTPIANPAALPGERVRPNLPASQDPPDLVAISDRIVAVTGAWTDRITGPLLALGEGGTDQLPLSASSCVVADPLSDASSPITRTVLCRALSAREARNQVVLLALEWLAARIASCTAASNGAGRGARDHTNGSVPAVAYGAGWTPAEAWYRAHVAASLALPGTRPDARPNTESDAGSGWEPMPQRARAETSIREFLAARLAAGGRPWRARSVRRLPTGLVRAGVRTADGLVAHGVGVDEEHAVDGALLRAVCAVVPGAPDGQNGQGPDAPGGRDTPAAYLAPPVPTWTDAVALVARRRRAQPALPAVDVSASLGFLDGDAFVVAVTVPGAGR